MSVIVTAEVYGKLFPDAVESFEEFLEQAKAAGATVSNTQSSGLSSALSILGLVVGLIAASILTGLSTAQSMPLGVSVAFGYAAWVFYYAEKLRRVAVKTTSLTEELPWNMCQTLSLLFVSVALGVLTKWLLRFPCGNEPGGDRSFPCSRKGQSWIFISGVWLPTLILSLVVWARFGKSATVLSINIFGTFLVFVLQIVATIRGFDQNMEDFAQWWFFGASMAAVAVSVYILAFQPKVPTRVVRRNAHVLVEVGSLVLWPTSFLICSVPWTSAWSNWIFANVVLVLCFTIAAVSECNVPLVIVVTGLFFDIFKVYVELSQDFPHTTTTQMAFTTVYLGGCAASLIFMASHVQQTLKSISSRIKKEKSIPLLASEES